MSLACLNGTGEVPLGACRLCASSGTDQVQLEARRPSASDDTGQVPLEACLVPIMYHSWQLEACSLYASRGASFETCGLRATGGASHVPLEAA